MCLRVSGTFLVKGAMPVGQQGPERDLLLSLCQSERGRENSLQASVLEKSLSKY